MTEAAAAPFTLDDLTSADPLKRPAAKRGAGGAGINLDDITTAAPVLDTVPFSERVKVFGQGATAGAGRTSAIVSGMYTGGKIGKLGGPWGMAGGALVGGVTGYIAGDPIQYGLSQIDIPFTDTPLTYENIESVPLNQRPYAVAGEIVGGSIPFSGLPYKLSRDGVQFADDLVGRWLDKVVNSAARMPGEFAIIEAQAAFGAAAGGGVAETYDPGGMGSRFTGELVGGAANPARWVTAAIRATWRSAKPLFSAGSATARTDKTSQVLFRIIAEAGEDPMAIAARIRSAQEKFPELNLTAGMLADSPALLAIEGKLARESARFGNESAKMAAESMASMRLMLGALESTGDPSVIAVAARMREQYFQTLLSSRMRVAEDEALAAVAKIDTSTAAGRAEYGTTLGKIMGDVKTSLRNTEEEYWKLVNKDIPGDGETIIQRFDELTAERLPEEKLPQIVEAFVRRLKGEEEELPAEMQRLVDEVFGGVAPPPPKAEAGDNIITTSGELIRFRSRMMALSRQAAAQNQLDDARVYGELAEAARDDLDALHMENATPEAAIAYDKARTWTREVYDVLYRTWAGKTLEKTTSGARRIPPELIAVKAFGPGREVGELQFRQLTEAAQKAGQEHLSRVLDVQEKTLRNAADAIVDTASGRVNPKTLADWTKKNEGLLNQFPELKAMLKDAETAERTLLAAEKRHTQATRAIEKEAAFSRVLKGESPNAALSKALDGPNPKRDFMALAKLARRAGKDGEEGLMSVIFTHALSKAKSADGESFSFAAYRAVFNEPVSPGNLPLKILMKQSGVMDRKSLNLMVRVLDRAATIENALKNKHFLDEALSKEDAMFDFVLRISGASVAKHVPTGEAHPLIVARAGSKLARQVFDKVPKKRIKGILIEASKNPDFMARLLESQKSIADQILFARQMNAFLWQFGITAETEEEL